MMGVKYLHDFIESNAVPNSVVDVDLIQLAAGVTKTTSKKAGSPSPKLSLVVDGECCLNRLYGGYFSDWICGGQWIRMSSFIKDLVRQLNNANIELIVFFNGAIEPQRMNEWILHQKENNKKIRSIFTHVNRTHKPPPKAWWVPPVGLRMAIRMMLRQMNVNVVCTIDDHRQEVIAYCRENNFHGLIADDAEYIAFAPPRLFSASQLRLTYHGNLHTKEYLISELMQALNLNNEKLAVLAALLGNYLLPDDKLKDVYAAADINLLTENTADQMVKKLANYLNKINVSSNLDEVVLQILGTDSDARGPALKQSIQYYLDGTKDGFLRYRSVTSGKRGKIEKESVDISEEPDLDTSALASEIAGSEKNILNSYKESTACLANSTDETASSDSIASSNKTNNCEPTPEPTEKKTPTKKETSAPVLPPVSHEVMRTLSDRHSKGLMSPYIYQILSQGEIKLPVILEDGNEIPNIYSFYKPIRQMVYAIVFNLHHHRYMATKENRAVDVDIRIKEWVFNKKEEVHKPEYVKAEPVGWRVPTIQRLWFGTLQDDKRRRLRAFLTCMRSDVQLILNAEFVPQQLLVAAVVLRYMMSFPDKKVLRKPELDAFIVTALCPEFTNMTRTQELSMNVSSRIVQIATMFMKGVEMAMLVNDACGAPIPWLMCCPWLFFDGKLFHYMCQKANTCKNLQELCDNRLTLVLRTERVRQAILEGLNVQFARPPVQGLTSPQAESNSGYGRPFLNRMRAPVTGPTANMNRPVSTGMSRGTGRRSMGARLEIAGVVVGSWGANYNMSQTPYDSAPYMMHPTPVSPMFGDYSNLGYRPRSTFAPRTKRKALKTPTGPKKKPMKKEKKPARGRGLTVGSSSGNMSPPDVLTDKSKQNGDEKKSNSVDSDLLNGNDTSMNEERFDDAVMNGNVGLMGEGDGPAPIKTIHETSSSLVGATTK